MLALRRCRCFRFCFSFGLTQDGILLTSYSARPTEEEQEERSFLCIDIPPGEESCLTCECKGCGVCVNARSFDACHCLIVFPLSATTCWFTFGRYSTWYSRTLCGSSWLPCYIASELTFASTATGVLFPLFFAVWLLFLAVDSVWLLLLMTIFGTVGMILLPLIFAIKLALPSDQNDSSSTST